ncbi:MAG: hypothetical protein APF81_16690 [Desulfosporosinus sp. BRH_c37]|nr:MAG: hypothetical protein APF81_16690 [Desulfosporosinus sp. BRH_c37]
MVITVISILVLIILAGLYIIGQRTYPSYKQQVRKEFKFSSFHPAMFIVLDRFPKLTEIASESLINKVVQTYGEVNAFQTLRSLLAEVASAFFVIVTFFLVLSAAQGGDEPTLFIGIFLAGCISYYFVNNLDTQIREKNNDLESDLPDYIDKVTLLINAGESIQTAMANVVKSHKGDRILYQELRTLVSEIEYGRSFAQGLDDLARRCRNQQVTMFATSVMLNYKRGGSELSASLRIISSEIWQNKRMLAKTKAEEASSKLVGPMMLIFIVVAVIVITPVMIMMK